MGAGALTSSRCSSVERCSQGVRDLRESGHSKLLAMRCLRRLGRALYDLPGVPNSIFHGPGIDDLVLFLRRKMESGGEDLVGLLGQFPPSNDVSLPSWESFP